MAGKVALKEVRTALDSKDFELAVTKAKAILEQDPENYHAYVAIAHMFLLFSDSHDGVVTCSWGLHWTSSATTISQNRRTSQQFELREVTKQHGRA
jgi:hypothetical protein